MSKSVQKKKGPNNPGQSPQSSDETVSPSVIHIASQYRLILKESPTGGFTAQAVEFPKMRLQRATSAEAEIAARETIQKIVSDSIKLGFPLPKPVADRRAQVNLRLSQQDKEILEAATAKSGQKTLSAFIRNAALTAAKTYHLR